MNAVSQVPSAQPTTDNCGNTPGGLLRQEREQRGLTVQQVSEQLLLDTWLVEALEENRFLALGAPVYAKGHLRKYAVLLGLSPDLILARYQLIAEPHPSPLPPPDALVAPPSLDRRLDWRRLDWRRLDWRIYAAIGGLALTSTAVGWLLAHSSSDSSDAQVAARSESTPAQPPADMDAVAPEATSTVLPAAAPPPSGSVPAAVQSTQSATNTPPPKVAAAQTPAAAAPKPKSSPPATAVPKVAAAAPPKPQASASRSASATTAAVVPPKVQAPASVSAATQPKPAAASTQVAKVVPGSAGPAPQTAAPEVAPEIPPVSLRLEFAVASWAEVYDGDGRRLLYAVGDPNRPRTISGKPPLKVTLGMAGSVQARVNGRPIAIPRRIGQDSASFTVTAKGSIR